jgi:hypothetical protein
MDLDFAVLADGVTGRPDGKLDIYGAGFDTIFAGAVPAMHPRLVLAVRVLISRHEAEHQHQLDVVLQAADGAELARGQANVGPLSDEMCAAIQPGRQFGLGMLLNFESVIFPDYGSYQLAIHWDGNEARSPLRLFVVMQPATG